MGAAPISGDHSHDVSGAAYERRGLAGVDNGLKVDL